MVDEPWRMKDCPCIICRILRLFCWIGWHHWTYKVRAHVYGPSEETGHRVYRECVDCEATQWWYHIDERWSCVDRQLPTFRELFRRLGERIVARYTAIRDKIGERFWKQMMGG